MKNRCITQWAPEAGSMTPMPHFCSTEGRHGLQDTKIVNCLELLHRSEELMKNYVLQHSLEKAPKSDSNSFSNFGKSDPFFPLLPKTLVLTDIISSTSTFPIRRSGVLELCGGTSAQRISCTGNTFQPR